MSPLIEVPCALCGARDAEPVYAREHETGSSLGRLRLQLVLCSHCGFLFASPRPDEAALATYYREAPHASGRTFRDVGGGSRQAGLLADRARFLRELLAQERARTDEPLRLIDVGCGRGDFLAAMQSPELECVGLEPSPEAVRVARERGFEVHVERLEEATLEPGSFDVVTCISALEHAFDPTGFLEELVLLVRPNGLLFIEVPDSTQPVAQVSEFYSFEHLSHFTEDTLRFALARAGLKPLVTERCPRTSALRCVARREASSISASPPEGAAHSLRAVLATYASEREELEAALVERIAPRVSAWRTAGARVALFGAGVHTRFLLDLIDFEGVVCAVVDSDPAKRGERFLDWDVLGPGDLGDLAPDAIVVSSKAYQDEIIARLSESRNAPNCEIVGCYPTTRNVPTPASLDTSKGAA